MTNLERDLGRRWFEQVWNQRRREAIAEMLSPEAVIHDGGTDSIGPEGFYPFYDRLRATFPDLHIDVEDTIAEGDKVCVRWSCTGKYTATAWAFLPPARPSSSPAFPSSESRAASLSKAGKTGTCWG
jgi:hypothetical protein